MTAYGNYNRNLAGMAAGQKRSLFGPGEAPPSKGADTDGTPNDQAYGGPWTNYGQMGKSGQVMPPGSTPLPANPYQGRRDLNWHMPTEALGAPGFENTFGRTFNPNLGLSRNTVENQSANAASWAQSAAGRDAPEIFNQQGDQSRAQQMQLADMYRAQAQGQGPSIAQAQLQQATDRNMAQTMALGAAQRGPNAQAQLKQLQTQRAAISQQAAADSGILRMQEQQAAMQGLGGLSGQMRDQDQQIALAQHDGAIKQTMMNDASQQFYHGQQWNMNENEATNMMNSWKAQQGAFTDVQALRSQQYQARQQQESDKNQMYAQMGGTAIMALASMYSDERVKENVVRLDEEAYPGVQVAEWTYKGDKSGTRYRGVIAQDLEKVAPQYVRTIGGVKTVDYSFVGEK